MREVRAHLGLKCLHDKEFIKCKNLTNGILQKPANKNYTGKHNNLTFTSLGSYGIM